MQTTDTKLLQVIDFCHELLKLLIPLIDKFPRARRIILGERLKSGLLAVLWASVYTYLYYGMQIFITEVKYFVLRKIP